ncbi:hypothetical protein KM043_003410 [Ampulex compressa]|nr:hypothetical protein KM043_003410 [Ampulex compressa]
MAPGLGGWTRTGPHCILRPVNPPARSVNESQEARGAEGGQKGARAMLEEEHEEPRGNGRETKRFISRTTAQQPFVAGRGEKFAFFAIFFRTADASHVEARLPSSFWGFLLSPHPCLFIAIRATKTPRIFGIFPPGLGSLAAPADLLWPSENWAGGLARCLAIIGLVM